MEQIFPADPFNYFFLDDFFNGQYNADQMFGKVFGLFASLAILIACFGLLGLSAYNILQRTKEIGIRKVLGASIRDLLLLLSKRFSSADTRFFDHCNPVGVVDHVQVAAGLRLSHQHHVVGLRDRGNSCRFDCVSDNKLPGY
jgi:hypothetical protein